MEPAPTEIAGQAPARPTFVEAEPQDFGKAVRQTFVEVGTSNHRAVVRPTFVEAEPQDFGEVESQDLEEVGSSDFAEANTQKEECS